MCPLARPYCLQTVDLTVCKDSKVKQNRQSSRIDRGVKWPTINHRGVGVCIRRPPGAERGSNPSLSHILEVPRQPTRRPMVERPSGACSHVGRPSGVPPHRPPTTRQTPVPSCPPPAQGTCSDAVPPSAAQALYHVLVPLRAERGGGICKARDSKLHVGNTPLSSCRLLCCQLLLPRQGSRLLPEAAHRLAELA